MFVPMLLALGLSLPPATADWTIVAENARGVMAIDPASIETRDTRRRVWTRAATIDDEGFAVTMLVRSELDCALGTMAKRVLVPLGEDGRPGKAEAVDEARAPVEPGTVGMAIFDRVCR